MWCWDSNPGSIPVVLSLDRVDGVAFSSHLSLLFLVAVVNTMTKFVLTYGSGGRVHKDKEAGQQAGSQSRKLRERICSYTQEAGRVTGM